MGIENIQKSRFLNTIFKMYYALGGQPNYNDLSILFGQYFSLNKPGEPLQLRYDDLNISNTIDIDVLNRIMITLLYNVDVLYDAYSEDIESLYSIVSSYKFRLDHLRAKRADVESKIDDYLFAIKNSDGFYYSVSNVFSDYSKVDQRYTTAYIDPDSRKVCLPRVSSNSINYQDNLLRSAKNVTVEVFFDGNLQDKNEGVDLSVLFAGLNNGYWNYIGKDGSIGFRSDKIGNCTIKISIPIVSVNSGFISSIEGRLRSKKPIETSIVVVDNQNIENSIYLNKKSETDYDVFSFSFEEKRADKIEIYLTKVEPDNIAANVSSQKNYVYEFCIDELIVSSSYYAPSCILVSNPISVPSGFSESIVIDKVMMEVDQQVPSSCNISYYVAAENPGASSIFDFIWEPIQPSNQTAQDGQNVVNFNGSKFVSKELILPTNGNILPRDNYLIRIPRDKSFKNPIENYFYQNDYNNLNFKLYRLAKLPQSLNPIEPYILENVTRNQLKVLLAPNQTLTKEVWQEIVSGKRSDIPVTKTDYTISSAVNARFFDATSGSVNGLPYGSIYMSTNVFCDTDMQLLKQFSKSIDSQYWDIEIYLNSNYLTKIEPGTMLSNISWNFKKGPNNIVLIINQSTNNTNGVKTNFKGYIDLFNDVSIVNVPGMKLYQNYFYKVKIEDLRKFYSNTDNVFSIINYENNQEIVYRRENEIGIGSQIYYYENTDTSPSAIRIRADLNRGQSPYVTPCINSYRVKFSH